MHIVIVVECETNLLKIIFATGPARGFSCLLDGGKQQGNQDGNNRDDD